MSVILDNVEYDFIQHPNFSDYLPVLQVPKVKFVAEKGYAHQREAYPVPAKKISLEWSLLPAAQFNLLKAWIIYIGSDSFWYVMPTSLKPTPNGSIVPKAILCRITDEEIPEDPTIYGTAYFYHIKITLESIGGEWE